MRQRTLRWLAALALVMGLSMALDSEKIFTVHTAFFSLSSTPPAYNS